MRSVGSHRCFFLRADERNKITQVLLRWAGWAVQPPPGCLSIKFRFLFRLQGWFSSLTELKAGGGLTFWGLFTGRDSPGRGPGFPVYILGG